MEKKLALPWVSSLLSQMFSESVQTHTHTTISNLSNSYCVECSYHAPSIMDRIFQVPLKVYFLTEVGMHCFSCTLHSNQWNIWRSNQICVTFTILYSVFNPYIFNLCTCIYNLYPIQSVGLFWPNYICVCYVCRVYSWMVFLIWNLKILRPVLILSTEPACLCWYEYSSDHWHSLRHKRTCCLHVFVFKTETICSVIGCCNERIFTCVPRWH